MSIISSSLLLQDRSKASASIFNNGSLDKVLSEHVRLAQYGLLTLNTTDRILLVQHDFIQRFMPAYLREIGNLTRDHDPEDILSGNIGSTYFDRIPSLGSTRVEILPRYGTIMSERGGLYSHDTKNLVDINRPFDESWFRKNYYSFRGQFDVMARVGRRAFGPIDRMLFASSLIQCILHGNPTSRTLQQYRRYFQAAKRVMTMCQRVLQDRMSLRRAEFLTQPRSTNALQAYIDAYDLVNELIEKPHTLISLVNNGIGFSRSHWLLAMGEPFIIMLREYKSIIVDAFSKGEITHLGNQGDLLEATLMFDFILYLLDSANLGFGNENFEGVKFQWDYANDCKIRACSHRIETDDYESPTIAGVHRVRHNHCSFDFSVFSANTRDNRYFEYKTADKKDGVSIRAEHAKAPTKHPGLTRFFDNTKWMSGGGTELNEEQFLFSKMYSYSAVPQEFLENMETLHDLGAPVLFNCKLPIAMNSLPFGDNPKPEIQHCKVLLLPDDNFRNCKVKVGNVEKSHCGEAPNFVMRRDSQLASDIRTHVAELVSNIFTSETEHIQYDNVTLERTV